MIADCLRRAALAVRFNLRIVFWAQAWLYGVVTYAEIPPDVRLALEQISIYFHGYGGEER
ncbi:hypothetical protein Huta_0808 [Halorhabdus utahensis DSM 12940]|uniref:Uncharacterized protein n=1 Tax=Halorhabdus utahensis (strain DSM 12940 / JCM 11049 / AX-2) TaxID=519442 RepID=C7NU96_HALUD|nr:hypothetical protein [Halorhabdus utahensis]ACV10993.1 hypothetical protein Huta_0808 [Halorhabdus utahensis DSM 12940]